MFTYRLQLSTTLHNTCLMANVQHVVGKPRVGWCHGIVADTGAGDGSHRLITRTLKHWDRLHPPPVESLLHNIKAAGPCIQVSICHLPASQQCQSSTEIEFNWKCFFISKKWLNWCQVSYTWALDIRILGPKSRRLIKWVDVCSLG